MVNSIMGATQGDIMTGLKPPPGVTDALAAAKAPPAAPQAPAAPQDPSVPALGGLGLFPAPGATPMDWAKMAQWKNPDQPAAPAPAPQPAAAPSPAPQASVPLPQPRPDAAPQAEPDMGFFQRNAMMMRDPITGAFIDPTGAATAQSVRGPDLIAKMMGYLSNKVA